MRAPAQRALDQSQRPFERDEVRGGTTESAVLVKCMISVYVYLLREKDCRMDNALRQQTLEATQVFLTL